MNGELVVVWNRGDDDDLHTNDLKIAVIVYHVNNTSLRFVITPITLHCDFSSHQ